MLSCAVPHHLVDRQSEVWSTNKKDNIPVAVSVADVQKDDFEYAHAVCWRPGIQPKPYLAKHGRFGRADFIETECTAVRIKIRTKIFVRRNVWESEPVRAFKSSELNFAETVQVRSRGNSA
jgi:hypothetical protein